MGVLTDVGRRGAEPVVDQEILHAHHPSTVTFVPGRRPLVRTAWIVRRPHDLVGCPREMSEEVFGTPVSWRAEIIAEFRLRGAERCAAASPAPGFPQLLDSLMSQLPCGPTGVWLDVGGGAGGIASWIERSYDQRVVVIDPAAASIGAATRLFGELMVAVGSGERLPVRDRCVDVVLLNGVISLIDDTAAVLDELQRVLRPNGRVAVTDIWSTTADTFTEGPNTFRSLEDFDRSLRERGLGTVHAAVAETSTGWWASAGEQVDDEIVERHDADAGFDEWVEDRRHLQEIIDAGRVVAAGVVVGPTDAVEPEPDRTASNRSPGPSDDNEAVPSWQ